MKRLLPLLALLFATSAQATISRVQHAFNLGNSITTATGLSVTLSSTGAGHALVAGCYVRDGTSGVTIAVTDNQSESWTTPAAGSGIDGGPFYNAFSFYVVSSTAAVTSVTFKPSGGGGSPYNNVECGVAEYSTTASGFAFDVANYVTGTTSGGAQTYSVTTTGSNDLVFATSMNANGDLGAIQSPYLAVDTISGVKGIQSIDLINVAAGAQAGSNTGISNGQTYAVTLVSIKETGAAAVKRLRGAVIE